MGQQSRVASPATAKISPRHSIGVNGRQTGTGKSWLACAFGRQAARLGHSVLYVRVPRMFEDLALARLDGSFPRIIDKLIRVQLLILDDFGTHALTDQQRFHLFEIVEERYQRKSTLIAAQLPVAPSPTPSSTKSCTIPTASLFKARACESKKPRPS